MEEQVTYIKDLHLAIAALVAVILSLASVIVFLWHHAEKRTKTFIQLTERSIQSSVEVTKAIENNTQMVRDLPNNIMLQIKASSKK